MRQAASWVTIVVGHDGLECLGDPLLHIGVNKFWCNVQMSVCHWRSDKLWLKGMEIDSGILVWELILNLSNWKIYLNIPEESEIVEEHNFLLNRRQAELVGGSSHSPMTWLALIHFYARSSVAKPLDRVKLARWRWCHLVRRFLWNIIQS